MFRASSVETTPSWLPSSPISRTFGKRIASFVNAFSSRCTGPVFPLLLITLPPRFYELNIVLYPGYATHLQQSWATFPCKFDQYPRPSRTSSAILATKSAMVIGARFSPLRRRTVTVPSAISLSPMISMYGILATWASLIL